MARSSWLPVSKRRYRPEPDGDSLKRNRDESASGIDNAYGPVSHSDHVLGLEPAEVTLIEYGF